MDRFGDEPAFLVERAAAASFGVKVREDLNNRVHLQVGTALFALVSRGIWYARTLFRMLIGMLGYSFPSSRGWKEGGESVTVGVDDADFSLIHIGPHDPYPEGRKPCQLRRALDSISE